MNSFKSAGFAIALALLLGGCASSPSKDEAPVAADESSAEGESSGSSSASTSASAEDQRRFRAALGELQAGNLESAEQMLTALLDASPGLAAAHNNLGVIYRRTGRFSEAEQQYKAALADKRDSRDAHLNLGILYDIYLQQPAAALEHYQRYQELSGEPDEEVALWITDLERRL